MNALFEGLAEEGAKTILEAIVVAILTAGAALIARNLARRGKVWVGCDAGRTRMSPYVLLVGLLCGAAATVFLAVGLLNPELFASRATSMLGRA